MAFERKEEKSPIDVEYAKGLVDHILTSGMYDEKELKEYFIVSLDEEEKKLRQGRTFDLSYTGSTRNIEKLGSTIDKIRELTRAYDWKDTDVLAVGSFFHGFLDDELRSQLALEQKSRVSQGEELFELNLGADTIKTKTPVSREQDLFVDDKSVAETKETKRSPVPPLGISEGVGSSAAHDITPEMTTRGGETKRTLGAVRALPEGRAPVSKQEIDILNNFLTAYAAENERKLITSTSSSTKVPSSFHPRTRNLDTVMLEIRRAPPRSKQDLDKVKKEILDIVKTRQSELMSAGAGDRYVAWTASFNKFFGLSPNNKTPIVLENLEQTMEKQARVSVSEAKKTPT